MEPACAEAARASLAEAGLADRAEVRIGPAAESLAALVETRVEPFDFVFIDADKPSNPLYLKYALRLTKPGSAILIDNMAYKGKIAVPGIENDSVRGTRQTFEMLAAEPRLSATAVQTVGRNGHDGFVLALVDG